jgi:hypothetical protein
MQVKDIIFTNHAIERAAEIALTVDKGKELLTRAERQRHNFLRDVYKVVLYGVKQCDVEYYRIKVRGLGKFLFTVTFNSNQQKWIVITVTKK